MSRYLAKYYFQVYLCDFIILALCQKRTKTKYTYIRMYVCMYITHTNKHMYMDMDMYRYMYFGVYHCFLYRGPKTTGIS